MLLNLVHDADVLMALAGPIVAVQATASNATRGFPVEDTAAVTLRFAGPASWHEPFTSSVLPVRPADPLLRQVEHLAAVVRGEAEPLVTGVDGLNALRVVEAISRAAASGRTEVTGVSGAGA